ncbi:MAG: hypothetical protein ALECFALPRED_000960 [Alectoria fallacina]|uniref:Uncharacterized protein n=1 Tax=Alectoria fallacina TaxID=1903189 RepID=A0A8H3JA53_9LECA|nr:MAG: hypothetical protein ALECFALPRED_000960 [Alectoria fallacina]
MYIPLALLTLLLTASALAFPPPPPPLPPSRFHLTPRQTNTPSSPGFMTGANVTVTAWTRSECGNNTNGDENIAFPNVLYGKNNHALVVSFEVSRDLLPNEQLDLSFFEPDGGVSDGIDKECALFQLTASPVGGNGNSSFPLFGGNCYTPALPVTCFNLWRTS